MSGARPALERPAQVGDAELLAERLRAHAGEELLLAAGPKAQRRPKRRTSWKCSSVRGSSSQTKRGGRSAGLGPEQQLAGHAQMDDGDRRAGGRAPASRRERAPPGPSGAPPPIRLRAPRSTIRYLPRRRRPVTRRPASRARSSASLCVAHRRVVDARRRARGDPAGRSAGGGGRSRPRAARASGRFPRRRRRSAPALGARPPRPSPPAAVVRARPPVQQEGARLLGRRDLPGLDLLLERLAAPRPRPAPASSPSSSITSLAAQHLRHGGALLTSVHTDARQAVVPRHRLGRRRLAARRQAVAERDHDGLEHPGADVAAVARQGAPRERLLAHEEAEPQVLADQRAEVRREAVADAQTRGDRLATSAARPRRGARRSRGPRRRPRAPPACRCRAAARPTTPARAARRRAGRRPPAGQVLRPAELLDDAAHVGERLQGVLEHVEVVVRVLLHAAQAVELRAGRRASAPHTARSRKAARRPRRWRATAESSSRRRSPLTAARPRAARNAASVAAASGTKSSPRARRARRSTRSGSSSSAAGEQSRSRRAARSSRPPSGSTSSPPSSGRASASTVKSRRAQVGLQVRAPRQARRPRRRARPVEARARQVPKSSEEANTAPPSRSARARENGSAAPSTTMSTSRTGRPSSSSRRQPPTSQPRSPGPSDASAAAVDLVGRRTADALSRRAAHGTVRPRGRRRGSGAPPAAPRRRRPRS